MEGLDIVQFAAPMILGPGEERACRAVIGQPRIVVLDRGGEKIEKAARRPVAGIGDHRGHRQRTGDRGRRHRASMVHHRRQCGRSGAHGGTPNHDTPNPRIGPSPGSRFSLI